MYKTKMRLVAIVLAIVICSLTTVPAYAVDNRSGTMIPNNVNLVSVEPGEMVTFTRKADDGTPFEITVELGNLTRGSGTAAFNIKTTLLGIEYKTTTANISYAHNENAVPTFTSSSAAYTYTNALWLHSNISAVQNSSGLNTHSYRFSISSLGTPVYVIVITVFISRTNPLNPTAPIVISPDTLIYTQ